MPHAQDLPAVARRGELLERGWTRDEIRQRVRSGRWVALLPGTYATRPDDVRDPTTASRTRLAAAIAYHGPEAVAVLGTAALLHGIQGVWPHDDRVHLALPPGRERHQVEGVRVHTWRLQRPEVGDVNGWRTTTAARTVADLVRRLGRMEAVSVLDSALHLGLIDVDDIPAIASSTAGLRGARTCRPRWAQARVGAESPLETRVRLRACDAGFAPDRLQLPIRLERGRTAYGDLAWRLKGDRWLVAEADGHSVHDSPTAIFRDRERANAITATGRVDLVRFTWRDTLHPEQIPRVLTRFLGHCDTTASRS